MQDYKKITFRILLLICIMAIVFAIPGFAETYDELKEKFVTRDEWDAWINGSGSATGISQVIKDLEANGESRARAKTAYEMSIRGMSQPSEQN